MSGESLAFHERSTKGAVPVPLKASESGVSVALLLNERLPELATLCCGVKVTSTDTFDPAGMVNGNLTSVTANSELLLEAEETVTLPPLALSFAVRILFPPTATSPKASVAGVIVRVPLLPPPVPVPTSGTSSPGPQTKKLPPVSPCACGLKVAFSFTFCPPSRVKGNSAPLTENGLPVMTNFWMVTVQERLFVNSTGIVELSPTATFPNSRLAGLALKVSLVVPEPDNPTVSAPPNELVLNVTCPFCAPAAVGEKVTLSSRLSPAVSVNGKFHLESVNLLLFTLMLEMIMLELLLLSTSTRRV